MKFLEKLKADKKKQQPQPPTGVTVTDYLTYKKSKFLLQISQIREFLRCSLNNQVLNGLLQTLENIMHFSMGLDNGYLVLQSIFITPETICLDMSPLKLCKYQRVYFVCFDSERFSTDAD